MSVYLSIHLSACLSIRLFIYPSIYLPIYLSVCLFIYLSVLCVQSCLSLCNLVDCIACQTTLSMGFSRQEYWSRLPFPTPGNLSSPGIKPVSPAMGGRIFTTSHLGSTPSLLDASILTAWRFYIIIWIWGFSWSMGRSVLICLMTITYRSQLIAAPFKKAYIDQAPSFFSQAASPSFALHRLLEVFAFITSALIFAQSNLCYPWEDSKSIGSGFRCLVWPVTSFGTSVCLFPSVGWFSLCTHLQNENVSRYSLEMLRKQYLKEP